MSVSVFVYVHLCVLVSRAAVFMFVQTFSRARGNSDVCMCVNVCLSMRSHTCLRASKNLFNLCRLSSAEASRILLYLVSTEKHSHNIWFIHAVLKIFFFLSLNYM